MLESCICSGMYATDRGEPQKHFQAVWFVFKVFHAFSCSFCFTCASLGQRFPHISQQHFPNVSHFSEASWKQQQNKSHSFSFSTKVIHLDYSRSDHLKITGNGALHNNLGGVFRARRPNILGWLGPTLNYCAAWHCRPLPKLLWSAPLFKERPSVIQYLEQESCLTASSQAHKLSLLFSHPGVHSIFAARCPKIDKSLQQIARNLGVAFALTADWGLQS